MEPLAEDGVRLPVNFCDVDDYLEGLLSFVQRFRFLSDIESTEYLTSNSWETQIPQNWRSLETLDSDAIFAAIKCPSTLPENAESLRHFLEEREKVLLPRQSGAFKIESSIWDTPGFPMCLKKGLSKKKQHEVSRFSELVGNLAKGCNPPLDVVDLGAGQGYLGMSLCMERGLNVLAIDDDDTQTAALKRRADEMHSYMKTAPCGRLYVTNQRVSPHVAPQSLCGSLIGETVLCGLHTCGNLAPLALQWFVSSPGFRAVANVGCCYNLCTERYDSPNPADAVIGQSKALVCTSVGETEAHDPRFPMSTYLFSRRVSLGFSARTTASLSVRGWFANEQAATRQYTRIFYRALFQLMLRLLHLVSSEERVQLGRFGKNAAVDFVQYSKLALERMGVASEMRPSDEWLKKFYGDHAWLFLRVKWLWTFRALMGEVYESLILMDRYKYLLERSTHGKERLFKVSLQPIFCPEISPRNFALIAERVPG